MGHDGWLVHNVGCLPSNARTTTDFDEVSRRLNQYHGVDPSVASDRLHAIKRGLGMGGADNVIFDLTGNVYTQSRQYIGTLTR